MESPIQEKPAHRAVSPATRALNAGLVLLCAGVIFLMYDRWGNTTELATYGRSAFDWMYTLWGSARIYGGSSFSLGWLIPLLTLALLWRDRAYFRTLQPQASWTGFTLVLTALFLHWMGLRAQQTRLSLLALVLLIWAVVFHLRGWPTARRALVPIGLLVFCVPLNFLDVFTFPLQRMSAALAGFIATGLGLAVQRRGSLLQPMPFQDGGSLPPPFDGASAAGGLGVMLTVMLLTVFWAVWHRRPLGKSLLLLAAVPLLHVLGNALRLLIAILFQAAAGESAGRSLEAGMGLLLVYISVFLLLLALDHTLVSWKKFRLWQLLQPTPPSIG